MRTVCKRYLAVALTAMLLAPAISRAAGETERMAARIPEIRALKNSGKIGEAASGLLAVRDATKKATAIVAAENKDRKVIYEEIAQKRGVKPEVVGQLRHKQLVNQAQRGDWIQKADGTWYQKE